MNTINEKICFVSEANQKNYINQFNNKINSLPGWFNFSYYVSTDDTQSITNTYPKLKVFDVADLQKEQRRQSNMKKLIRIQNYSNILQI